MNGDAGNVACHTADRNEIPSVAVTADCRAAVKRLIADISYADKIDCFIRAVACVLFDKSLPVLFEGKLVIRNSVRREASDICHLRQFFKLSVVKFLQEDINFI